MTDHHPDGEGSPDATVPEATLDPILTAYFADLAERGVPKVWEVTPQQARDMFHIRARMMRELDPPPELPEVRDIVIPDDAHGTGGIPARVYRPIADLPLPTVLYAHGGGWVICDVDTHDAVCRRLAVLAQAVVVSIDYRLGPEHPFPAAVDDALTAARWVGTHLAELGGSHVWAMAGDSAGGGLTAVATHVLRDERRAGAGPEVVGPPMAAQLLIYPATDPAGSYESRVRLGSGYGLETESIDYFMRLYAGTSDPAALTDPRLSPLRYPDHTDLPSAIVATGGFDPLIDEDVAYLEALRAAGVTAEWQNAPGLIHGFVDLGPMIPAAAQALESMGRRLGELLRGD